MGIRLMTYVKDNLVFRSIKHIVKSYDEFDRTEAWSQVAGIYCTAFNHVLSDLLTKNPQVIHAETFDILR